MLRLMVVALDAPVCALAACDPPDHRCPWVQSTRGTLSWCDFASFARPDKNFLASFRGAFSPETLLRLLVCEEFDALRYEVCVE